MKAKKSESDEKVIFIASIGTSLFLLLIYMNSSLFHSDFQLIGVVQELFTIPCIIGQPVFLFLAIRFLYKSNFSIRTFSFMTAIVSLITLILSWGSIIMQFLK